MRKEQMNGHFTRFKSLLQALAPFSSRDFHELRGMKPGPERLASEKPNGFEPDNIPLNHDNVKMDML